jgi:hypothetical protein
LNDACSIIPLSRSPDFGWGSVFALSAQFSKKQQLFLEKHLIFPVKCGNIMGGFKTIIS